MKSLGYLLIALGFLAGAWVSVADGPVVVWSRLLACLAAGATGITLVRLARRRDHHTAEKIQAGLDTLDESLSRIVEAAARLDREKTEISVYDVRHRIDDELAPDIAAFVEARERIAHRYGLQTYALVMTHFATGERYLNRCWSASTDGWQDEVREYLGRAHDQLATALSLLRGASSS